MVLTIIGLLAGFFVLLKSADYLVDSASSIAKRYGISPLFIGLTIVAFGSSAPELIVNIFAAIEGASEIALGNVMGSNIANILLGLGAAALVRPLVIHRLVVWREIPFAVLGAGMIWILVSDQLFDGVSNVLTRVEGLALIGFFVVFLYFTFKPLLERGGRTKEDKDAVDVGSMSGLRATLSIIGGLVGLVLGGSLIVNMASGIASALGVSEALIALTVVAAGTSLPEIAATVIAARKGHAEIAVGNIVGSVTFNTLWIMGLTAVIRPLEIYESGVLDVLLAFLAIFLLFPFMTNQKRVGHLDRWEGGLFVAAYVFYIGFTIWRG